jgi:hypothetical protein
MAKRSLEDIYIDGRVALNPIPITSGKKVTVKYRGLLSSSGADSVYMHYGYGMHWSDPSDKTMIRGADGSWSCDVTVEGTDTFNFCFRDSIYNWDNNSGLNWGCDIQ